MRSGEEWDHVFQQAAFDPSRWDAALRQLADATGSTRAQLIGIGNAAIVPFNWVTDFPEQSLADFVRIGGASPTLNYRIAADRDAAPGAILHERQYTRARATLTGDTYLDFCRDTEIPHGCHTALIAEDEGMIGLATLRREADGITSEVQREVFARAAAAARVAVRMQMAIEHHGAALLAGSFDALSLGCFLIDRRGVVGALSPAAEAQISAATPLRIAEGRLGSARPQDAAQIDRALRDVFAGRRSARVPLGGARGTSLELFRLTPRDWSLSFRPQVVAVIRDPAHRLEASRHAIAAHWGLSAAETDIAILLALGKDRDVIAARRGVSLHTLRTQMRSLYDKMDCHREAEIVSLIYRHTD